MTKDFLIGYAEFIRLCQIDAPEEFAPWATVKTDGVYIKEVDAHSPIFPEERAVLTEHPMKDMTKPALSFPCTLAEMTTFIENNGLLGCIDDEHMETFIKEKRESKDSENKTKESKEYIPKQKTQEKVILDFLRSNNIDPMRLPKPSAGKPGIKAHAWNDLKSKKEIFGSRKVFDLAWDRLRANSEVKDEANPE